MHINKSQIYHTNLFSFLVGFYPLAYILGNSIINVLTTLITILGLGLYRKKIFFCSNKIYTLLLLSFFFYLACTSIINNYPKLAELPNYLINIKNLDLHGVRHKEALEAVHQLLNKEKESGSFSVTIITGNSSVLQDRIFKEVLDPSPFTFFIPSWNLGQIIVEYMEL